jgi:hypothetical protein
MDKATIKRELFAAVAQLSSRGICHAAKWCETMIFTTKSYMIRLTNFNLGAI